MKEAAYIPWSWNTFSPGRGKVQMTDASEKRREDLHVEDLKLNDGVFVAYKRPTTIVENVLNVITKVWNFTGQIGTSSTERIDRKEELCDKNSSTVTSTAPVFETKKDGTGQLTVPLDYDRAPDDMTPPGVYVEETPRSKCTTARTIAIRKRFRRAKGMVAGGSESVKDHGKNWKDKKRQNLRMDIASDSSVLPVDECYGYDYREAEFEDAVGSASLSQTCCLSSSFSPSSLGSVESFHDALQDALVMEACMQYAPAGPLLPTNVYATPPQQTTLRRRNCTIPTPRDSSDRVNPKCDTESGRSGFVVFSDYDVYTTPSASPARRIPPRGVCKAFTYVWHRRYTTACQQDKEEDENDDENWQEYDGYSSDDVAEDEEEFEDDEDDEYDDDDCVVFCEELDDNDDTNSSSGFEEKKVRFNMKPAVHVIRAWDFAYRQARKSEWEMAARDRERFRKRIADLEPVLGPALQSTLRDKIYTERFSGQDSTRKKT